MNFDLNTSAATQDMSTTFIQAIPKFVRRRGALMGQRGFGWKHGASNTGEGNPILYQFYAFQFVSSSFQLFIIL